MTALATISGMDRYTGRACTGLDHVRQSIMDILTTPIGSRVCNRDYGSNLQDLIDAPMNGAGVQAIFAASAMAIATWYPFVTLTKIEIDVQQEPGQALISLTGFETGAEESSSFTATAPITLSLNNSQYP
jgi:uncharacterized protein